MSVLLGSPKGIRRRNTNSPISNESLHSSETPQTPLNKNGNAIPIHSQHRGFLRSLLGFDFFLGSSSSAKITPENIYATANISAFAALLSLIALVVGIITLMLTHERSLLSTMKTSYEFMKELSEGYHAGIAEIERKTGGNAQMDEQLSQFVQTMHALPWRQLRESIDQQQLEELFKVLSNLPQTMDQVQDMAWSICVALRRILGLTTDYCIPSDRHPPSKIIIAFKKPDELRNYTGLMMDLKGEYLEKGLLECVSNWHKQTKDEIVNLLPLNRNNYKSLSSMIAIKPQIFEKLIIHQHNEENIWSTLYGLDIMLINRFVLHNDADWHIDHVQITNLYTFPMNAIIYNPTDITATIKDIFILVKTIKVRDPVFDAFSEFHIFETETEIININYTNLTEIRTIEYVHSSSPFIRNGETHKLFQRAQAKKKSVIMDRDRMEWIIKIKSFPVQASSSIPCSFKARMDKALHKKSSWSFCSDNQKKEEVPPIILFDEIQVLIANNPAASGVYKLNDSPFEIGYFAEHDPNTDLIFVMKKDDFIYRLFMAKSPDYQWYIQRFNSRSIAINSCRLSIINGASNTKRALCSHVVPYKGWTPSNNAAITHLRALSVEFSYDKDRIHSIYFIYKRYINDKLMSDDSSISLLPQIIIKGNDVYFKIYTKKDDKNLDQHYNQIVLDLTTFNALTNMVSFCKPKQDIELPTLKFNSYRGKVEAIGGEIVGNFIIIFYQTDDCRNLFNTIRVYNQPVSFLS